MKKQSIALTALTLLASSAAYGCTYNFHFGCDEQRQKLPMAQCHNTAQLTSPLPMPVDDTQKIYGQLGQAVVDFFSKLNPVASEENFGVIIRTRLEAARLKAAEIKESLLAEEEKAAAAKVVAAVKAAAKAEATAVAVALAERNTKASLTATEAEKAAAAARTAAARKVKEATAKAAKEAEAELNDITSAARVINEF